MTDRDFDRMLSEQLAHQPVPESAVRRVTPWSTAIGYLTWGLILTTLHLDFLYLQYLLPTVGFALLVLGLAEPAPGKPDVLRRLGVLPGPGRLVPGDAAARCHGPAAFP